MFEITTRVCRVLRHGAAVMVAALTLAVAAAPAVAAPAVLNEDTGELFDTIQQAVDDADTVNGHTLRMIVADHAEGAQIVVSKTITLIGDGTQVIRPVASTGGSGDARGWFLVPPGSSITVRDLVFDGAGFQVYQAFRVSGEGGTFIGCTFRNINFQQYIGLAMAVFGNGPGIVVDCTFENIERIGALFFGAGAVGCVYEGNTYTGKGDGDFLDYAVEFGAGATGWIRNNTIVDCRGIATSDGSTSCGSLATTFFGAGTNVQIIGNRYLDNAVGVGVGFGVADTTIATATCNVIVGNGTGMTTTSSTIVSNGEDNWWGDPTGPADPSGTDEAGSPPCFDPATMVNADGTGDSVDDLTVDYCPWKIAAPEALATGACVLPDGSCVEVTEDTCALLPGDYFGDGTPCVVALGQAPRTAPSEKGSLLVFSKIDLRWDGTGNVLQDTFLSLTNDYPGEVRVQMYFINGDPPLEADPGTGERAHPGWNYVDNQITLTGDQPTYWSALTGLPAAGGVAPFTALDTGFPPGRPAPDGGRMLRGWAVAWAVNAQSNEIRWNHLSGVGTLVHYGRGSAWEYGTTNYKTADAAIGHGEETGTPGFLHMNGVEYSSNFSLLLMNFQAAGASAFSGPRQVISDSDLTLHPVFADLRQEYGGPVTTKADVDIWNMNEIKFSETRRCITCWDQTLLSSYSVPNGFRFDILQTPHGKARIDGVASQQCDVDYVPGDGPIGTHPLDVVSQPAALLGVIARQLLFDGGADYGGAGANLVGLGYDASAEIRFDITGPPPEAQRPESPAKLLRRLERVFGVTIQTKTVPTMP
ncbi:MAG: right-handed parallel beta-helix repeat-containing protein [Planctomycetes bacterium]|nr:right-handed parallel beta-helix repeat-containing protein [Planctomycetota bacterium]